MSAEELDKCRTNVGICAVGHWAIVSHANVHFVLPYKYEQQTKGQWEYSCSYETYDIAEYVLKTNNIRLGRPTTEILMERNSIICRHES